MTQANDTILQVINNLTGELYAEYKEPIKVKKFYLGPRNYQRIMKMYDKALCTVPSLVGIQLLTYIKSEVSTSDYCLLLKATSLANLLNVNVATIKINIKKLLDGNFIHRLGPSYYMVNPRMFWIKGMSDITWSELKNSYDTNNNLKLKGKVIPLPEVSKDIIE